MLRVTVVVVIVACGTGHLHEIVGFIEEVALGNIRLVHDHRRILHELGMKGGHDGLVVILVQGEAGTLGADVLDVRGDDLDARLRIIADGPRLVPRGAEVHAKKALVGGLGMRVVDLGVDHAAEGTHAVDVGARSGEHFPRGGAADLGVRQQPGGTHAGHESVAGVRAREARSVQAGTHVVADRAPLTFHESVAARLIRGASRECDLLLANHALELGVLADEGGVVVSMDR